jgi:hypothetical protein
MLWVRRAPAPQWGMVRWTPNAQRTRAPGEVHWLGDAPFVPMMETSHLGKFHDLSCVWPVNSTGRGASLFSDKWVLDRG